MKLAVAFVSGLLFALGLAIGGMTQPGKVLAFLDVAGDWDPSLAFVMAGAVLVHAVAYRTIRGRKAPLFASAFDLPTRRDLDGRLIGGAALFGVGWGLGGYCPGPALTALVSFAEPAVVFVVGMVGAMAVFAAQRAPARLEGRLRDKRIA